MHISLPRPDRDLALFLDFDGTLVGLAPTPEAVQVPPGLVTLLAQLQADLDGALAVVSGRPIEALDALLAPLRLPTAGEHGAQRRDAQARLHQVPPPALGPALAAAQALVARHPALQLERKQAAIALHYRAAPPLQALCLETMTQAIAPQPELALLHGKCVVEIKPARVDKGRALAAFMAEPPFAGRCPVMLGDDTTDEAAFAYAQSQPDGLGIKVGAGPSLAAQRLAGPAEVMAWLQALHARCARPNHLHRPADAAHSSPIHPSSKECTE